MNKLYSLLNRDEIRRLQKAARESNKKYLYEWASQFEDMLRYRYNQEYKDEVQSSIENLLLALMYTLYFSEETILTDKSAVVDFMTDLVTVIDGYRTGQYKPEDYKNELLSKAGIKFNVNYEYDRIYKERVEKLDNLIKYYEEQISKNTLKSDENPK